MRLATLNWRLCWLRCICAESLLWRYLRGTKPKRHRRFKRGHGRFRQFAVYGLFSTLGGWMTPTGSGEPSTLLGSSVCASQVPSFQSHPGPFTPLQHGMHLGTACIKLPVGNGRLSIHLCSRPPVVQTSIPPFRVFRHSRFLCVPSHPLGLSPRLVPWQPYEVMSGSATAGRFLPFRGLLTSKVTYPPASRTDNYTVPYAVLAFGAASAYRGGKLQ
jgi:hypothetical protein